MAAAVLAAAVMTACAGSDELTDTPQQPENQNRVITLTTTVGLGGGAADATRALSIVGDKGVKTFAVGEKMALHYANKSNSWVVKESEPLAPGDIAEGGKSATFTFRLTEEPNKSSSVNYFYPAAMLKADGSINYDALFTEQDGTLATLASKYDLATAENKAWVNGNLPGAELTNQLAVLAITLKDYRGSKIITGGLNEVAVSAVTSEGTNTYTVTPTGSTFGQEVIYVAILPAAGATIKVTATGGTKNYIKTLTDKTYEINNGYNVSWRMTDVTPTKTTPLTVEALTDGTIVVNNPRSGMKYSVNGGAKATVTSDAISVSAGDKVHFYGNSAAYYFHADDYTSIAGGTAEVKVYGNIMSLMNETDFATATTLPANNTFGCLFRGNTKLTNASSLLLPAKTMKKECYTSMFSGCTGLTAAPALPATMLAGSCYYGMFSGCTSLTTAPALPATKLADNCYQGMFYGCSSLTTAPALPATTLKTDCYYGMFYGCTSLTAAPALPATTLVEGCYRAMFYKCRSLETAPALPAPTLKSYCYYEMFYGCTKLRTVTCLATNIGATGCTKNWLEGVAVSGRFYKAKSMNDWETNSPSGVPSGWDRLNAH